MKLTADQAHDLILRATENKAAAEEAWKKFALAEQKAEARRNEQAGLFG